MVRDWFNEKLIFFILSYVSFSMKFGFEQFLTLNQCLQSVWWSWPWWCFLMVGAAQGCSRSWRWQQQASCGGGLCWSSGPQVSGWKCTLIGISSKVTSFIGFSKMVSLYVMEDTFQWLILPYIVDAVKTFQLPKCIMHSILTLTVPSHRKGTQPDPHSHGFELCAFWGGIGRQLPRKNIMNNCKWWQKIPYAVCTLKGLSPLRHFYMLPLMMLG